MLSEQIVVVLAGMPYQPNAEWDVNIFPFGSIYWKDEMPVIGELISRPSDMAIIFSLFGMRLRLWDSQALSAQEQELWDGVRRQVPDWALFQRITLSDNQRLARKKAEQLVEEEIESLGADD